MLHSSSEVCTGIVSPFNSSKNGYWPGKWLAAVLCQESRQSTMRAPLAVSLLLPNLQPLWSLLVDFPKSERNTNALVVVVNEKENSRAQFTASRS